MSEYKPVPVNTTSASPTTDTITIDRAEYEAMKADAERYRWLCIQQDVAKVFIMGKYASKDGGYGDFGGEKNDIDQAIDQARNI